MNRLLDTSFKFSLLRNSLVQLIWWVIFFPGFFSGDSFGAVNIARTGEMTNAYTASWALYVRIFSFHGHAIGLLTLLNGLFLVYAVTRFGYALFSKSAAAISTFLLTLTPIVVGMGLTLWHDILMSAGILLLTSFFINHQKTPAQERILFWRELVPGAALVSFRPNGLPTLLVFVFLYLCFLGVKRNVSSTETVSLKAVIKFAAAAIVVTSVITFISSNIIIGMSPINNYYAQEWMRGDISCYANTPEGQGFVEKEIPGIGSTQNWASQEACVFLNKANLSGAEKTAAQKFVPKAWLELAKRDPLFVFQTHINRHEYLIPLPISGIPTIPFLHSTIEFEGQGIEWAFPAIAEKARILMRAWNAGRGLTGWAGLWALVLIVLAIWRKQKALIPAITMSIAMIGILFVVAPIPDGRYALFVLIAGQLALLGNIVEWAQTGSNRRPTD